MRAGEHHLVDREPPLTRVAREVVDELVRLVFVVPRGGGGSGARRSVARRGAARTWRGVGSGRGGVEKNGSALLVGGERRTTVAQRPLEGSPNSTSRARALTVRCHAPPPPPTVRHHAGAVVLPPPPPPPRARNRAPFGDEQRRDLADVAPDEVDERGGDQCVLRLLRVHGLDRDRLVDDRVVDRALVAQQCLRREERPARGAVGRAEPCQRARGRRRRGGGARERWRGMTRGRRSRRRGPEARRRSLLGAVRAEEYRASPEDGPRNDDDDARRQLHRTRALRDDDDDDERGDAANEATAGGAQRAWTIHETNAAEKPK